MSRTENASTAIVLDGALETQKGAALPWNAHGYYEVALDAGTLTLAS
jgi:hypothetical protein